MSRSTPSTLQDLIAEMQALQAHQQEETRRLRRRLDWLESRRREFFEIMSANASDLENRRRLEEAEQQSDQLHAMITRSELELKTVLQELRQRIIDLRNEELSRMEEDLRQLRERKDHIHHRLLPEIQAQLNTLQEEEAGLTRRLEETMERIRELNQLDPSTYHQSRVA